MELLIVLTSLCLLSLLAMCYGSDRQDRPRWRDEEAAALRLTWHPRDGRLPRLPSTAPAR